MKQEQLTPLEKLEDAILDSFLETPYLFFYRNFYAKPKDFIHSVKNYYLRKTRGAGCCDVFSLDYYLAKQILPGLKLFRSKVGSFPCQDEKVDSLEKWKEVLDKMIFAFEYTISDEEDIKCAEEDWKKAKEGYLLFGEYFRDLWD